MIPALSYCRFSPRPRNKLDTCESIELQDQLNRRYAELFGIKIVGSIVDRDTSARTVPLAKRVGGSELLERLAAGEAQAVLCLRLERIFRNVVDGNLTLARWRRQGIALHLAAEGGQALNTTTATGRFLVNVLLSKAEYEPDLISERTSEGMRRRQANRQRMTPDDKVPYGWQVDPKNHQRLLPHVAELEAIGRVLELTGQGYSARQIARMLDAGGYACRASRWHHQTVLAIQRRPALSSNMTSSLSSRSNALLLAGSGASDLAS